MTAADITSTISIEKEVSPNLAAKMHVIRVTCTENDDWVQMSTAPYSYTTVYAAFALVTNALEAVTIADDTKIVFGAGGTDTITVLVIGV